MPKKGKKGVTGQLGESNPTWRHVSGAISGFNTETLRLADMYGGADVTCGQQDLANFVPTMALLASFWAEFPTPSAWCRFSSWLQITGCTCSHCLLHCANART